MISAIRHLLDKENLEDMFELYMKNRDMNVEFVKNFLRENIHLQITKSCILGRMIDSASKPITRKVFMINMIKYVYNKIGDLKTLDTQFNIFNISFSSLDSTRP